MSRTSAVLFVAASLSAAAGCDTSDPGIPEIQPLYRPSTDEAPSNGERGNLQLNEIHFGGSVSDDGTLDADDVFIELWNKHPRPINPSGWRVLVGGDYEKTYRIPDTNVRIEPNGYFVIAAKSDGAFGEVADLILPDLKLGVERVHVELRDIDRRLMESGGSTKERVFAGGWDTVTTRSMERVQLIFGNRGENPRNWHAYSDNTGLDTIAEGYRENTLASPGEANSGDYSGSASSGNFE